MEIVAIFAIGLFFILVTLLPRTRLGPYLGNDGPLFGNWSQRVAWFSDRANDKIRYTGNRHQPDIQGDIPIYWECDAWDCWRLWTREDNKNLALVTADFTWRVFTAYLVNSRQGYVLVEEDDLLAIGIRTFDTAAWTPTIMGHADSLEIAKQQAERTIKFIQGRLQQGEKVHGAI